MDFTFKGVPIERLEFSDFCQYLQINGSQKKADFDKKIIKTNYAIFGLTSPQMQAIFKYLKKVDHGKILLYPSDEYFEITQLQGLLTVSAGKCDGDRLSRVESWIKYIDNWALCDTVMSKIPIKKNEKDDIFGFAVRLAQAEDEFTSRCGIIIFLSHYLDDEHIDKIFEVLKKVVFGKFYYVDMAVAWFAATALIKYKSKTVDFLDNSQNITDFVYNKSFQKARESYRISQEDKEEYKAKILSRKQKRT